MSSELDIYKKNRINELLKNYNNNIRQFKNTLNKNILEIQKSARRIAVKNRLINSLIQIYNSNMNNLKTNLNNNIRNVQNFVPANIRVNNNKYAIIIGINYTGTPNELYGCINDANSIKEFINNKGYKNINVMTDLTDIKANKNNILDAFTRLLQQSLSGDIIFLFYSGHGTYTLDKNGDETTGYDQLIVPCDLNMIVDDELKNIIQTNLKKDVTLFAMFDSCFSGSVLDLKYNFMDSLNYDSYTENNNELETNGHVLMISGCTDYQTSTETEFNGKQNGALTWSFLKSLKEGSNCSWRELVKKMRDNLKSQGFNQIPQFSCGMFENIDAKAIF
jgi:hypothetical protein